MEKIFAFANDEQGLTVVEYSVGGALISLAVVVAYTLLGQSVDAAIVQLTAYLP